MHYLHFHPSYKIGYLSMLWIQSTSPLEKEPNMMGWGKVIEGEAQSSHVRHLIGG